MRGYPFQMLIRKFGFPIALVVTSAIFGAMHIGNQNSSNFGTFATFVIGVALGCAVRKSGGLWLPTGIHTGWNMALPLLGVNLSGRPIRMTRFEVHGCTDALWCGGAYGIEAGVPAIIVTALLLLGIWYSPIHPALV